MSTSKYLLKGKLLGMKTVKKCYNIINVRMHTLLVFHDDKVTVTIYIHSRILLYAYNTVQDDFNYTFKKKNSS